MSFSPENPTVSLFVPTWNAGSEFPEIFRRMKTQELDRPYEILIIDSGSSDGTVEFLVEQGIRLIRIPNHEFNHGLTRNRGIEEARGEIVVLATQGSFVKAYVSLVSVWRVALLLMSGLPLLSFWLAGRQAAG